MKRWRMEIVVVFAVVFNYYCFVSISFAISISISICDAVSERVASAPAPRRAVCFDTSEQWTCFYFIIVHTKCSRHIFVYTLICIYILFILDSDALPLPRKFLSVYVDFWTFGVGFAENVCSFIWELYLSGSDRRSLSWNLFIYIRVQGAWIDHMCVTDSFVFLLCINIFSWVHSTWPRPEVVTKKNTMRKSNHKKGGNVYIF